jgi:MerR family transcriptional regulator, copper efflux regulator
MPESRRAAPRRRSVDSVSDAPPAPSSEGVLHIGDLATRAGVSADTLRYYERRGLLQPSGRRASGYREYTPEAADVVHFIKHAQALGFTLAEVEELLPLRQGSARREVGLEVRDVAVAKIRDIDDKLRLLGALRNTLVSLVAECDQTCGADANAVDTPGCPIITALDSPDAEPSARETATRARGRSTRAR